jgi:PAP2 superfamily
MSRSPAFSVLHSKRQFLALGVGSATLAACGSPSGDSPPVTGSDTYGRLKSAQQVVELANCKEAVLRWNKIAIDATGLDHKPPAAGEARVFAEQMGPGRSSRAMAIIHIAMYDALCAIVGKYQSVSPLPQVAVVADLGLAIAQAARDALVALFPAQATTFNAALADELAKPLVVSTTTRALGLEAGKQAAAAILGQRGYDGSAHAEPVYNIDFIPLTAHGTWSPDPITGAQRAIGARWPQVRPFALNSGNQFRSPPPPALGSADYVAAYNEVQALGGDGVITPTSRTPDQTFIGNFWAYDGTPSLCAPPRLYNQIVTQVATQQQTSTMELARLLMLVNVAMADSGIAAWDTKYHYQLWRPVTGLRASPSGAATGSSTPNFTPLGAPASNLTGPNFTPPFPAYVSGHATFGGALFQVLRKFYGRDDIQFTFTSDEYNGVTKDNTGAVRPWQPRTFANFSQAEEENGQSRIYLGIHWSFDKTEGILQGRKVADWVQARLGQIATA